MLKSKVRAGVRKTKSQVAGRMAASANLELSVSDATGLPTTFCITPGTAQELIEVLSDYSAKLLGPVATRVPERVDVCSALYERVVLFRFDGEAPYALQPEKARAFARALLAEAGDVELRPAPLYQ